MEVSCPLNLIVAVCIVFTLINAELSNTIRYGSQVTVFYLHKLPAQYCNKYISIIALAYYLLYSIRTN